MTDGNREVKNILLVHGGFVDGSGWQGVYDLLRKDGYKVAVVQNPTLSLEGDVAATKLIIDAREAPLRVAQLRAFRLVTATRRETTGKAQVLPLSILRSGPARRSVGRHFKSLHGTRQRASVGTALAVQI